VNAKHIYAIDYFWEIRCALKYVFESCLNFPFTITHSPKVGSLLRVVKLSSPKKPRSFIQ